MDWIGLVWLRDRNEMMTESRLCVVRVFGASYHLNSRFAQFKFQTKRLKNVQFRLNSVIEIAILSTEQTLDVGASAVLPLCINQQGFV